MAYLGKLKSEQDAIEKQITEMVVYSNGSISWTEAWLLSIKEREMFIKTVNRYNSAKSGKDSQEYM